jgi:hypothetical protein
LSDHIYFIMASRSNDGEDSPPMAILSNSSKSEKKFGKVKPLNLPRTGTIDSELPRTDRSGTNNPQIPTNKNYHPDFLSD